MSSRFHFEKNGDGTYTPFAVNGTAQKNGTAYSANGMASKSKSFDRKLKPRTVNQGIYLDAVAHKSVTFCIGPAGTGKTYIAAGYAAKLLRGSHLLDDNKKWRIAIVRPAVEAGKPLGFLPGKPDDKLKPYVQPFLREMSKFISEDELRKYRSGEVPRIEICPLQFMRGSTFEDCFVVFDEAQNATFSEMEMFLTRLGKGSKMIVDGDPRQSDLPIAEQGALEHFSRLMSDDPDTAIVTMSAIDNQRHPFVQRLLEKIEHEKARDNGGRGCERRPA